MCYVIVMSSVKKTTIYVDEKDFETIKKKYFDVSAWIRSQMRKIITDEKL